MGEPATWIAGMALLLSLFLGLIGYFRKSPFISVSIADELRLEIKDLRSRLQDQSHEIDTLRTKISGLMGELEWYREEYRKLKISYDNHVRNT